jgi:hypothetical protein
MIHSIYLLLLLFNFVTKLEFTQDLIIYRHAIMVPSLNISGVAVSIS